MHHSIPPSGDLGLVFLAALLGGVHCAGMCGPYVAICSAKLLAANSSSRRSGLILRLLFNAGRVTTYAAIGAMAGALGGIATAAARVHGVAGGVSCGLGVIVLLLALSVAGYLPAAERLASEVGLDRLIRAGVIEAFRRPPYRSALLLGLLQGLLPCALVYGAAGRAASTGSAGRGAVTMLIFGIGTLPALFALTFAGKALPAWTRNRRGAAAILAILGILLVLRGLAGWGILAHGRFW